MRHKTKEPLTPRELEITQYLACGLSPKEIAARISRSVSTVSNTLRNVYEKHGFNRECELVAFYFAMYHNVPTDFDVVGKIKRAVGAVVMVLLLSMQITLDNGDNMIRARRCQRRSKKECEIEVGYIIN